jgi:hypothetical protein
MRFTGSIPVLGSNENCVGASGFYKKGKLIKPISIFEEDSHGKAKV